MNFKAMNMKKGLKRLWIVGSVFWFVFPFWNFLDGEGPWGLNATIGVAIVGLWWALLYLGLWIYLSLRCLIHDLHDLVKRFLRSYSFLTASIEAF